MTSDGTYTNMGIQSITLSKSPETGYAREIPITFKKIRTTAVKDAVGGVSSSYGNGGSTGVYTGTANTYNITYDSNSTAMWNVNNLTGNFFSNLLTGNR